MKVKLSSRLGSSTAGEKREQPKEFFRSFLLIKRDLFGGFFFSKASLAYCDRVIKSELYRSRRRRSCGNPKVDNGLITAPVDCTETTNPEWNLTKKRLKVSCRLCVAIHRIVSFLCTERSVSGYSCTC